MASVDTHTTAATHDDHEPMDLHHMIEALKADFLDEINDSDMYWRMGECAEDMGMEKSARNLYEMSKDEYTHARFIHWFLTKHKVTIPEDQMAMYEKTEERIEHHFL